MSHAQTPVFLTPEAQAEINRQALANLGLPIDVASGGTGTATPSLVAGANVGVTGTWPNQTVAVASAPPSGSAGGDLSGTYPNPTVVSGAHLANASVPNAALVTTPLTTISGISAGGDLGSTYPNPQVTSGAHLGAGTVPMAALATTFVDSEVPTGTINGSNKAFTLAHNPISDAALHVYADGLRTTAFTRTTTALTMTAAPVSTLVVDYRY